MSSMQYKAEAYKHYKQLKELGASEETLNKALDIVNSIDSGFENLDAASREDRQQTLVEENETVVNNVKIVDDSINELISLGASEDILKRAQEIRRIVADPLDITEEIYATGAIAAEGLTAGIAGDEMRAYARSFLTGDTYDQALTEERRIEAEMFEQHPVLAYTTLIGTSLIPSSIAAKAIGVGKTALSGALRQGGLAATEGAVFGAMEGETTEERIRGAMFGATLGGAIGGGVGGLLGRAEGRAITAAEEIKAAQAAEKRASMYLQGKLTEEIDGKVYRIEPQAEEVILAFQGKMETAALKYLNEEGKALEGLDYGVALKQASEELGVPITKLRHAEATTGKSVINFDEITEQELRKRVGALADDVGFVNGRYNPNQFVGWVRRHITSLQRQGEKYVSPRFGAALQRTASLMARRHAETENIVTGSNVLKFSKVVEEDQEVNRLILNMSQINFKDPLANIAERKEAYDDLVAYLRNTYDEDTIKGFEAMRNKIRATSLERIKKIDSEITDDAYYWPSQYKAKTPDGFQSTLSNKKTNTSSFHQKRDMFAQGDPSVFEYDNAMTAAVDFLRRSDSELSLVDVLKLKNINVKRTELKRLAAAGDKAAKAQLKALRKNNEQGDALFNEVVDAAKLEGADLSTANKAQDMARSLVVMGSRGPSGFIANLRKAAYMGTIGNPYSAVLNVGDVFNSMVNYGADNTIDAIVDMMRKRGVAFDVNDLGLAKQTTGEFLRDGVGPAQVRFNQLSDKAFQLSGFTSVDRFGKNVALRAAMKEGIELARKGKLEEKWGHAFNPNELQRLKKDLLAAAANKKPEKAAKLKTPLMTEFAAAQLARLQPSDMAQLPKWYLDHPNWRVLYMLRTFGLKQLDQMERLVVQEWQKGNKNEAMKNALAYTVVVGGGNAFINEGRQIMKGDEPQLKNIPMRFADHMLGATLLNTVGTYQLQRAQAGEVDFLISSVAPAPLGMALAPIVDIAAFGFGPKEMDDFLVKSETLGWLPFGRIVQDWFKE